MTGPLDTARLHWGDDLPDWVELLAVECGRSSAARVAEKLDRSPAVISQVLRRKYPAETTRLEERVRGVFLDARVPCPVEGTMPLQQCQDWREKSRLFQRGNPLRTRMFRACNACPRNQKDFVE